MPGIVGEWFALWRDRPVTIESTLPVEVACERLAKDVLGFWARTPPFPWRVGMRQRIVVGRVSPRRIRLTAMRAGTGNAWGSQLRAELRPSATGSVLDGTLGWQPAIRAFSFVTVGVAVGLLAAAIGAAITLPGHSALSRLVLVSIPTGMMLLNCLLIWFGGRSGRKDGDYLLAWLDDRLRPAE